MAFAGAGKLNARQGKIARQWAIGRKPEPRDSVASSLCNGLAMLQPGAIDCYQTELLVPEFKMFF